MKLQIFKKIIYFLPTFMLVCVVVFVSFVLPKFISPDDFGEWRLIMIGLSFSGLCHLGYLDGLLYKWNAGKQESLLEDILPLVLLMIFTPLIYALASSLILGQTDITTISILYLGSIAQCFYTFFQFYNIVYASKKSSILFLTLQPSLFLIASALLLFGNHRSYLSFVSANIISFVLPSFFMIIFNRLKIYSYRSSVREVIQALVNTIYGQYSGWKVLTGGLIFLLLMNLDKLILTRILDPVNFASYTLWSGMPAAGLALATPIGNYFGVRFKRSTYQINLILLISFIFSISIIFIRQPIQMVFQEIFANYNSEVSAIMLASTVSIFIWGAVISPELRLNDPSGYIRILLFSLIVYVLILIIVYSLSKSVQVIYSYAFLSVTWIALLFGRHRILKWSVS